MIENLNSKNSQIKEDASGEIDLKLIFNLLLRNKKFISLFSIITLFFGILYSYTLKEVWEGQFQIVLNVKNKSPNLIPQLANLGIINNSRGNELKTEVEILKSPSVLMPIFEFAKSQQDQSQTNNLRFTTWKKNLNIELEKNTSILNISYRNTNKKTIIPVLNKMSFSYQEYSGKNKRKSRELTYNFLKGQISIFKKKSAASLRAAQEYATEQDLIFYNFGKVNQNNLLNNSIGLTSGANFNNSPMGVPGSGSYSNNPIGQTELLLPNVEIEITRVQAANQIRKINLQIQKIKELNDPEELLYIGSTIPALEEEGLPKALSDIEKELVTQRSKYTEKDIAIITLNKKRKLAMDLLKSRAIKYLETQKLNAEAKMEASMRPKGVLLRYKELIRESARDEKTLIQLEDQLNLVKLDLAGQEEPWELITKPTLLANRVAPSRRSIASFSLMIGLLLSSAFSILKEKKSGKIYDASEIEKFIPIKLISQLNLSNIDSETQNLLLIHDLLNKESSSVINFVPIGNIEPQKLQEFKETLINKKIEKEFEFSSVKDDLKKYSNYLILRLGYIKYSDVFDLKKRMELLENKFKGLIVLS